MNVALFAGKSNVKLCVNVNKLSISSVGLGISFLKEVFGINRSHYFLRKMSGAAAATKLSLPGPLRAVGKKHIDIATQWVGSALAFGATAGVTLCYATDWRVVVDYIPFYNGKFKEE